MVSIRELSLKKRDRKRFLAVEFRLHQSDPCWVPPLRTDRMTYWDPDRNPFFEHAEVVHFVALREGRDVGRIAAIQNHLHEEIHEDGVGFFGFLECGEDPEVLAALLNAAAAWLRKRGRKIMRGPTSYDTNEMVGVLVDCFDDPPMIMMPWNRPSLPGLLEGAGLVKAMDLLAFNIDHDTMPERIVRIADRQQKRQGVDIRCLEMDRFDDEVRIVRDIYNRAWEKNWGFVPLTDREIDQRARDLKHIVDPDFVFFAMVDDREVGFSMTLPDANQALAKVRSGRLFPFGFFRLLLAWKKIDRCRMITMGMLPEFRNRGLETMLYLKSIRRATELRYTRGECSWVLETNEPVRRGVEACGGYLGKRYRLYDLSLEETA